MGFPPKITSPWEDWCPRDTPSSNNPLSGKLFLVETPHGCHICIILHYRKSSVIWDTFWWSQFLCIEGGPYFMKILTKQSNSCPYFVKQLPNFWGFILTNFRHFSIFMQFLCVEGGPCFMKILTKQSDSCPYLGETATSDRSSVVNISQLLFYIIIIVAQIRRVV